MKRYDAIVIGGGVLGCFTARNLRRWNISTLLLEAEEDVCSGVTRANSAIVYAGYDNKEDSLKAQMTVRGNLSFDKLCNELDVPFERCGSLLVSYEEKTLPQLQKRLDRGNQNGVPGLRLLSGEEACALEPMLAPGSVAALYAPSTGTTNPWQLGIAAYENALHNGCEARMNAKVFAISKNGENYIVESEAGSFECRAVLNCAGLYADKVQELLFMPSVRLEIDAADYMVLDEHAQKPSHVIFHQEASCGKGITAIPGVEGNLLLSGIRRDLTVPFATTQAGLKMLHAATQRLLPEVDLSLTIRSFGAVRPNPHKVVETDGAYVRDGRSLGDFCIENPAPGFYSLIGVKTPGLTCANELGLYLAEHTAKFLSAERNEAFDPVRKAISAQDDEIVCQCGQISRAEIKEAIARGAKSVSGVKRRVGSGMGRCQGSRCAWIIQQMLEDAQNGKM